MPPVIYVERLNLQWLWQQAHHLQEFPGTKVFYIGHDPWALLAARKLSTMSQVSFHELQFQCADVRTKDGRSVRLKIAYEDWAFLAGRIGLSMPASIKEHDRLFLYMIKAPVAPSDAEHKYSLLRQAVTLIEYVRWHAQSIDFYEQSPELYLFPRIFLKELDEFAQSRNVRLCLMPAYHNWQEPIEKVKRKLAKINGQTLQSILRHLLTKLKPSSRSLAKNKIEGEPKLLVESRLEFNLNHPECTSDLFFLDENEGIKGQDVMMVFNGSFNPITPEKYQAMQERHIAAVALTPQSSLVEPSKVPVFSYKPIANEYAGYAGLSETATDFALKYARSRRYWEAFFKENNIKLWTSFYKNEVAPIAMADALAMLGGISSMYQRSYEPNSSIIAAVGADIIFGFSKAGYEIERGNGSVFRYHIATGFLGDYRFKHIKGHAAQLRDRLKMAGAKHIIAYFDESTIDDGRWFFDHKSAQVNYAFWLEKLLAHPDLGLIFKPKISNTLRQRLGPVAKLLEEAEKTGRCQVLEETGFLSSIAPAAASLASDIAIHEDLSAGTAGLEAALAGSRTLLMDFVGWPQSPLYKLGPKVVFKDWTSAWEEVSAYFKNSLIHQELGNWSAMINELDPFHDGKAALRMSWFLKQLLEGLRRGESRDVVMDKVAESYAKQWGKDKVARALR